MKEDVIYVKHVEILNVNNMKRYLKVKSCENCGNDELEYSNIFYWNVSKQKYEPMDYYDAYCTECSDHVPVKEVTIEDNSLEDVQVI